MRRSKTKTPSGDAKNKRTPSEPRIDWIPPHPALGAQVNDNKYSGPKSYWPTSTSSVYFFYIMRITLANDHILV